MVIEVKHWKLLSVFYILCVSFYMYGLISFRDYSCCILQRFGAQIANVTLPITPCKKRKNTANIKDSSLGLAHTSKHVSVFPGDSARANGEPYFDVYLLGKAANEILCYRHFIMGKCRLSTD